MEQTGMKDEGFYCLISLISGCQICCWLGCGDFGCWSGEKFTDALPWPSGKQKPQSLEPLSIHFSYLHYISLCILYMYEVSRYIMYDIDYWGILVYSFMNHDDIYILYMYFHVFLHSHLPKNVFGFFCLRWNRRRMGIEWMFQVLGKSSTKMWSLWMVSCFCLLIATGWWLHCAPIVRGWNYQDQRKDRAVEGPKDSSVRWSAA